MFAIKFSEGKGKKDTEIIFKEINTERLLNWMRPYKHGVKKLDVLQIH
jgi:hypothetical protein